MRDKLLQIRVDDDFIAQIEYLRRINGYKSNAETIRNVIDKEFRKERCNSDAVFNELNKLLKQHDDSLVEHGIITESERTQIPKFLWDTAISNAKHSDI